MNKDLTVGNPQTVLLRFSLPLLGSVVFQQLYNIADSLVAGRWIGENALAAVGNAYEITLIFIAFAFGCNIGCSVVVSRHFGARRYSDLRAGRMMRDERASNRKKIKVITRAIHRDVSEDSYNLDSYNYEIARLEAEIEDVAKRKQENLNTFEAATKKVIADEIMENNKDRILKIQDGYQKLHLQLIDADKQLRAQTMQITANYEPYLGKDFLDSGRVDSLIELVDSGKASTITEAITVYRESKI